MNVAYFVPYIGVIDAGESLSLQFIRYYIPSTHSTATLHIKQLTKWKTVFSQHYDAIGHTFFSMYTTSLSIQCPPLNYVTFS